jgi:hypothetical protein
MMAQKSTKVFTLGVAVEILEVSHRCGKQRILVCRVYSEWLNLFVCRQCEALRLIWSIGGWWTESWRWRRDETVFP